MLFVYDDSGPMPPAIRQMIAAERFGDVLTRRRRLADIVEQTVAPLNMPFVRLNGSGAAAELVERLDRAADGNLVFRLPSCLMSGDLDAFAATLRKLPYALTPAAFGPRFGDEQVALLSAPDLKALLAIRDPAERRAFFAAFDAKALKVDGRLALTDLRTVGTFLRYMSGATEARHFNATEVSGGVFRKSSSDIAKMRGEYRYFHVVPEPMRRFLLPTFDWREEDGRASYAMENLSVPDAAIQFVHNSFDPDSFALLLDRFFDFIGTRAAFPIDRAPLNTLARGETIGKMERRLDALLQNPTGRRLDAMMKASGPCGGIAAMRERARPLIEAAIAADRSDALVVSHGDPCLSNILFNRDIGLFRLIDPRGATALDEALMHPLYDIAKFSHSILGGYDFINNGLFEWQIDERLQLGLTLDGGGAPAWMREAFRARLVAEGFVPAHIRAFELSLFLSMLPLHVDVPKKLPAFCLTACAIMHELERAL